MLPKVQLTIEHGASSVVILVSGRNTIHQPEIHLGGSGWEPGAPARASKRLLLGRCAYVRHLCSKVHHNSARAGGCRLDHHVGQLWAHMRACSMHTCSIYKYLRTCGTRHTYIHTYHYTVTLKCTKMRGVRNQDYFNCQFLKLTPLSRAQ